MPKATVNGIGLYYQVHGEGEPLVLIQGLTGGHESWYRQVPFFSKHFRVVIFDNRGIGRSDISPQPYNIRAMADDTIGLMDHLGIEKAHILGLSLGGMVAQEIAISYPRRVDKLVLCSTTSVGEIEAIPPDMIRKFGFESAPTEIEDVKIDPRKLTDSFISTAFNKWAYRIFLSLSTKFNRQSTLSQDYKGQLGAMQGFESKSRLHLIQAPTLVITGAADRLLSPDRSDNLAELIPNARLLKVKGGSHAFFLEMSDRFNKEILTFLTSG